MQIIKEGRIPKSSFSVILYWTFSYIKIEVRAGGPSRKKEQSFAKFPDILNVRISKDIRFIFVNFVFHLQKETLFHY